MTLLATLREDIMKLKRFDATDFLDSDEAMVEYLNAALEEDDPRYFAKALGNVTRAKGMSSIGSPASAPSATQDTCRA